MRIVFLDSATIGNISLAPIENLGELITYPTTSEKEALSRVADAEILIVNKVKVTKQVIESAPKLRLICEAATGVNNIDLETAKAKGIPVKNVSGYSTDSVVQITFAQILNLISDTNRFDAEVKDLIYSKGPIFTDVSKPYSELSGKTIGIVGLGAIGTKVAKIAEAFGMNIIYYSTSGTNHSTEYKSVSKQDLLSLADVISIHAPLNDRTRGLIGKEDLNNMKRTAIIVNMARGGIIDETALAEAIDNELIAGAAIDVYTQEPPVLDNPLLHTKHPERLRFTPHIGWASQEAIVRLIDGVANNIREFLKN